MNCCCCCTNPGGVIDGTTVRGDGVDAALVGGSVSSGASATAAFSDSDEEELDDGDVRSIPSCAIGASAASGAVCTSVVVAPASLVTGISSLGTTVSSELGVSVPSFSAGLALSATGPIG